MDGSLPDAVAAAIGGDGAAVRSVGVEAVRPGSGAATGDVVRLRAELVSNDGVLGSHTLIRKVLRPLPSGRHAALAADPRHWAYWRREVEAYRSGLLPTGPGVRGPRCFGVVDETLYLEDVGGSHPTVAQAAGALARWQVAFDASRDRPWLAMDQLGRRLDAGDLDWTAVDADRRAVQLWERRHEYYERLRDLPKVLSHGDFSLGNLVAHAGETVVAFDWATFGWEPIGFDLAHLALSAMDDPVPAYQTAAPQHAELADVGYRCALAVIGASRVHWMLSRSVDLPSPYVDFLWDQRPIATR
jgi:hypothetical protein